MITVEEMFLRFQKRNSQNFDSTIKRIDSLLGDITSPSDFPLVFDHINESDRIEYLKLSPQECRLIKKYCHNLGYQVTLEFYEDLKRYPTWETVFLFYPPQRKRYRITLDLPNKYNLFWRKLKRWILRGPKINFLPPKETIYRQNYLHD